MKSRITQTAARKSIPYILIVIIIFTLQASLKASEKTRAGYMNVSPTEAMQIINTYQNIVIIDIREQSDFEYEHLTGAVSIPLPELENALTGFKKNISAVVYCQDGSRSSRACELLTKHGFTSTFNITGGIDNWKRSGLTVTGRNACRTCPSGRTITRKSITSSTSSAAFAGYCPSNGGDHTFEYLESIVCTPLAEGVLAITVIIDIANPAGCVYGQPCPDYDNSPEYVNGWIDWNGDKVFEETERVLDASLTGYMSINYAGTMSTSTIVTIPDVVAGNTFIRVNVGWSEDPNDPCQLTWNWGDVMDRPVEIKVDRPRIEDIVITGIPDASNPMTSDPSLTGLEKVKFEAIITPKADYVVTGVTWSGDIGPGEGNPWEYTASPGSHGEKNITCTVSYRNTISGAIGTTNLSKKFKLFFNKYGDDDGDGEPNWFKYWMADGAVPGMAGARFDGLASGYGYTSESGELFLTQASAGQHFSNPIVLSTFFGTESFGGTAVKGIDCTAEIIGHELYRKWVADQWKTGGFFYGNADSDKGLQAADHNDHLPDSYESATSHTSNANTDTWDLEHNMAGAFKINGDLEYMSLRNGNGLKGIPALDWANPGKQSVPPYKAPGTRKSLTAPAAPVSATFTGTYTDAGVDENSDGLYEYLKITAGINVTSGGLFNLVTRLTDGTSREVARISKPLSLNNGVQTIDLMFDGLAIQQNGSDGPYKLTLLLDDEFGLMVDYKYDIYQTFAYDHNLFKKKTVSFTGTFDDHGTDTDNDGLYNFLTVEVGVNITTPGSYLLEGGLYDQAGNLIIELRDSTVNLATGIQNLSLNFDGTTIYRKKLSGPYRLRYLNISRNTESDFIYDAYVTLGYSYEVFQKPTAAFSGEFTEHGVDTNGDTRYEYLEARIGVDVLKAGNYILIGYLYDSKGVLIQSSETPATLNTGRSIINLRFDGTTIYRHGVDGPYTLQYMSLIAADGTLTDIKNNAGTTAAYSFTSFQRPPDPLVTLNGTYSDTRRDTNGDGKYEFLSVSVGIRVASAGYVVVKARLADAGGAEICWAENIVNLNAGNTQTIQLDFDGELILSHGVNGPYTLKNVYIYHTGDPSNPDYEPTAYTTGSYPYSEFAGTATGIGDITNPSPDVIRLGNNYPNPFTGSTAIEYNLQAFEYVTLKVYDVNGLEVATLVNGYQPAGSHSITWTPNNLVGGVYFCKLRAGSLTETRKILYQK